MMIHVYTLYDNSVNISGRPTGCMMAKSPSVQRNDPIGVKLLVVGMTNGGLMVVKNDGLMGFNQQNGDFNGIYPLVN